MGASESTFQDEIQYVTNIQGLPANSSSPTDTWIVTYKTPGEQHEMKLFWKMFILFLYY